MGYENTSQNDQKTSQNDQKNHKFEYKVLEKILYSNIPKRQSLNFEYTEIQY